MTSLIVRQAFHEYRFDWDPKKTVFYIDGVKKGEFTQNVPQVLSQLFVLPLSHLRTCLTPFDSMVNGVLFLVSLWYKLTLYSLVKR